LSSVTLSTTILGGRVVGDAVEVGLTFFFAGFFANFCAGFAIGLPA
jgi:hypothetical protein